MRATQPGQSALLLLDVVDLLVQDGLEYAVIGAMAASVHGVVRASLDADAVAFISLTRARRLLDQAAGLGLTASLRIGDFEDPVPGLLALEDAHGNRVDLLIGLRGLDRTALMRTLVVPFHGTPLTVLGREDLVATKLYAAGPLDLVDAEGLVKSDRATLDVDLLRRLADRYGSATRARLETLLSATDDPPDVA